MTHDGRHPVPDGIACLAVVPSSGEFSGGHAEGSGAVLAQTQQEQLTRFCRSHGIRRAALFGSLARGEDRPGSDIDLLVTFDAPKSLLSVVRLERELGAELGRKVELLTEEAISPHIRSRIAGDLTVVYES